MPGQPKDRISTLSNERHVEALLQALSADQITTGVSPGFAHSDDIPKDLAIQLDRFDSKRDMLFATNYGIH
ncbi:hypothetical protein [Rhizobium mongolense]